MLPIAPARATDAKLLVEGLLLRGIEHLIKLRGGRVHFAHRCEPAFGERLHALHPFERGHRPLPGSHRLHLLGGLLPPAAHRGAECLPRRALLRPKREGFLQSGQTLVRACTHRCGIHAMLHAVHASVHSMPAPAASGNGDGGGETHGRCDSDGNCGLDPGFFHDGSPC
ncbi:hypothetical protein ebA4471 [Aromatoleum aromaticum EbN1]|uniref:Uncharacterized protein n=1 Tax=Aromatoleum aromaticum (strain DSM 19018 / LMG 30748 / EbN1) TaxID=76114 RepID=Q5P207_AROAE|nr:hypothetical protein ebA4471 [Aromatoleum aromaticum EbN1]